MSTCEQLVIIWKASSLFIVEALAFFEPVFDNVQNILIICSKALVRHDGGRLLEDLVDTRIVIIGALAGFLLSDLGKLVAPELYEEKKLVVRNS